MFWNKSKKDKNADNGDPPMTLVRQDPQRTVRMATAQSETTQTTARNSIVVDHERNCVIQRTTQQTVTHRQMAGVAEITTTRRPTAEELATMFPTGTFSQTTVTQDNNSNQKSFLQQATVQVPRGTGFTTRTSAWSPSGSSSKQEPFKKPSNTANTPKPSTSTGSYTSPYRSQTPNASFSSSNLKSPATATGYTSPYSSNRQTPNASFSSSNLKSPATATGYTSPYSSNRLPAITASADAKKYSSITLKPTNNLSQSARNVPKLKAGCAIIINSHTFDKKLNATERDGTEYDKRRIQKTLEKFKLSVEVYDNPKKAKIDSIVRSLKNKDFTKISCLVFVILSHGDRGETIFAYDQPYNIDETILQPLLTNVSLQNKPKIFFIQACKGDTEAFAFKHDAVKFAAPPSEVLKCYSTFEGYVAFRTDSGSPFIRQLCTQIEAHGNDKDLKVIMDTVISNVKEETSLKQIPSFTSSLSKPFIFGDYI